MLRPGVTTVHVPVLADREYATRFVTAGERLVWRRRVMVWQSGRAAMVLPEGIGNHTVIPDWFSPGVSAQPATIHTLPRTHHGYDGASFLLLHAQSLERIEEEACAPLVSFIRDGGTVAVVTDEAVQETVVRRCDIGVVTTSLRTLGAGRIVAAPGGRFTGTETSAAIRAQVVGRHVRASARDLVVIERPTYATRGALAALVLVAFGIVTGPMLFFRIRRREKKTRFLPILAGASFGGFAAMVGIGCAFGPRTHTETTIIRDFPSGATSGRIVETRVFHRPKGVVKTSASRTSATSSSRPLRASRFRTPATSTRSAPW